jgi:predicted hotdog family 3-hydroxylacyl-ACP dehydratase
VNRSLPDVAELVPQAPPMLLLSRVLSHEPGETRCAVEVDRGELFQEADGSVPGWVALEYMAQCAAAHGGLVARGLGEQRRPGIFLGSRRVQLRTDRFEPGQVVVVTARHHRHSSGLVVFDCRVDASDGADGPPLAEGRLNFYTLGDWSELTGGPA